MRRSTRRGSQNRHRRDESSVRQPLQRRGLREVRQMNSHPLVTSVFVLGLLVAAGAPALAHHGNAAYDDKITEFKQATVTKASWANPHVLIDFDAKDATGQVVHMV